MLRGPTPILMKKTKISLHESPKHNHDLICQQNKCRVVDKLLCKSLGGWSRCLIHMDFMTCIPGLLHGKLSMNLYISTSYNRMKITKQ